MTQPTELLPGIRVFSSRRYFSLSTTVVGHDGTALVIDPNWDADEIESIPVDLDNLGVHCALGLSTHVHYDHVLWHERLGMVPRYSSRWTVRALDERRDEILAPLVGDVPTELINLAGRLTPLDGGRDPHLVPSPASPQPVTALPEPYAVPWSGRPVVVHEHDAHAPAHLAVEVLDQRVLICADMCSDVELPMPDEANPNLIAYLAGLDRLAEVARRCDLLIPGHGTPTTDPMSRIDADRRYLDAICRTGRSDDPRIALPDMADLHASNLARARATEV